MCPCVRPELGKAGSRVFLVMNESASNVFSCDVQVNVSIFTKQFLVFFTFSLTKKQNTSRKRSPLRGARPPSQKIHIILNGFVAPLGATDFFALFGTPSYCFPLIFERFRSPK